ncbi:T9SS type A sorting domain-containing protein [Bizionia arctica]|uniref:Secretion system C-terminal sorting domain-containing protein n=1 Tax=Bizionia arctica TaxID=1495645 RepID=A0A917GCV7_9FLAO|nr:T9SS type A sorting domain-containing protein [Bizionia arctica]GGG38992.1 hypothetical protein GCM10010976_08440 [Bizionia arctica]
MKKNTYLMALFFAFFSLTYGQITLIPDAIFETRLVNAGIDTDGAVNGQMLTADANSFTGLLSLSNRGISDLTGIEAFTNITALNVDWNNITNLDLTNNTLLTSVNATGCSLLTSLNVTGLTNLSEMLFAGASLASLDVTTNSGLTFLNIRYNNVTSLDLSQNHIITTVHLKDNGLTYLDLRNGNQDNMIYFDSDDNHNLPCIFFDDSSVIDIDEHIVWFFDDLTLCMVDNEAQCSSCLQTLSINDTIETAFNMYPNPANGLLHITTKLPHAVVSIYSITGKVILTKNLTDTDNLIDVSELASGLYLARFSSDNQIDTKKLVIN